MTGAPAGLRRGSVISIGVSIIVLSLVIIPVLPMTLPAVCVWWLADDLLRNQHRRPSWLGWVALALFGVAAVGGVGALLMVDTHFDCGGTLGGFGESADARLDEDCRSGRLWRPIVGVSMAIAICVVGARSVGRSDPRTPPIAVAARTFGAMIAAIVIVTLILVFT